MEDLVYKKMCDLIDGTFGYEDKNDPQRLCLLEFCIDNFSENVIRDNPKLYFKRLQKHIHNNAINKGFHVLPNIGEKIALIHSELSEALESDRKERYANLDTENLEALLDLDSSLFRIEFADEVKDSFEDELADVFIRLLDLAELQGIDLFNHVLAKHKFNQLREYKHGKKY